MTTQPILNNYQQIQETIDALKVVDQVQVIVVSKYAAVEAMKEAYNIGLRTFGESRQTDALKKQHFFQDEGVRDICWHFIGTLQSNKIKKTVANFDVIQSVSSVDLLKKINIEAQRQEKVQSVFLQCNFTPASTRNGFSADELSELLATLKAYQSLSIDGLMTMAPPELSLEAKNNSALETYFSTAKAWAKKAEKALDKDNFEVSMGMSNDYKTALKCGSTMIRIGNGLFKN
ncbi:MAG: YggS family pyridoxal phosphate-dependent enzyme [Cyanobacteria bacterium P01_H01_bin.74]